MAGTIRRRKNPPKVDPKPPKDPNPVDPPQDVPKPTPVTTKGLGDLAGKVRTLRPNSPNAYGVPWSNVGRYAKAFTAAGKEFVVDPFLMAAMAIVESDSNQTVNGTVIARDDGFGDGLSVGILQPKPRIWQSLVPNADAYTVDGNIRLGTAIMADAMKRYRTWQRALTTVYFPANDPNSTTQSAYVETVTSLMAEMRNQLQGAPSPVDPTPVKPTDPYSVIFGGHPYRVEYGFRDDVGLNYYLYGVDHGTTARTQHTGDDVLVPDETPLYAPFDGVVSCLGWEGWVTWGQGCGYFEDVDGGGIGNITITGEGAATGYKLVLGHSSRAFVDLGAHVKAGQKVGASGSMNGPHTHVEVAVEKNGSYWLVDPKPALIQAMGGVAPVAYADRQPFVLSDENPEVWVEVTAASVPVLQYANPESLPVRAPLKKGERFQAGTQVLGTDGTWFYLTSIASRIPKAGTKEVAS